MNPPPPAPAKHHEESSRLLRAASSSNDRGQPPGSIARLHAQYSPISARKPYIEPASSAARMRPAFARSRRTASMAAGSCVSQFHTTLSRMFFAMRRSPVK